MTGPLPDLTVKLRPASWFPLLLALAVLGGAAAAAVFHPGCLIRDRTGLKCPACGSGRSLTALAQGNPGEAFYWNALFPAGLLLLAALAWWPGSRGPGWLAAAVGILAFGVLRNLDFYLLY